MDQSDRSELIEGTKAIWSVATYVPSIGLGALVALALRPLISRFESEPTQLPPVAGLILVVLLAVAAFFSIRAYVWRPIRDMYQLFVDPDLFWAHCREVSRMALPYTPLIGIPIALLCFDLNEWLMVLQLGVLVALDRYILRQRLKPIAGAVDRLLMQISTT